MLWTKWFIWVCADLSFCSVDFSKPGDWIGFSNNKFHTLYSEKFATTCLSLWIIWDHAQTSRMKKSFSHNFRSCKIFLAIQHVFDPNLCMIEASIYSFAWLYQLALQQLLIFNFCGPLKKMLNMPVRAWFMVHLVAQLLFHYHRLRSCITLKGSHEFIWISYCYIITFVHTLTLILKEWWRQTRSFQDW